jgi:F0F1-type ATP synthase assembly protein I
VTGAPGGGVMNRASEEGDGKRANAPGRGLYGGFGDALAQAFEFAVIPVMFAVLGIWLDSRLGTRPWATVVLVVIGLTGVIARSLYAYKDKMETEERGKPWTRRTR